MKNKIQKENCSTKHKVMGVFALVALFVCGAFVGNALHFSRPDKKQIPIVEDVSVKVYENTEKPCETIERVLGARLSCLGQDQYCGYEEYFSNADVYSTMATKGCPENSDKFKQLALNQLEIASALDDGNIMMTDQDNARALVDIYKKLKMRKQAEEFLGKLLNKSCN